MAYGFSIFCDDIRDEIGSKISFIGVYRNAMYVHGDFPFAVPKFCIYATFIDAADKRPLNLSLHIFFPGDPDDRPSFMGDVPLVDLEQAFPAVQQDPEKICKAETRLQLAPFVISQAGDLKVRFLANGQTIRAGALSIERAARAEPSSA